MSLDRRKFFRLQIRMAIRVEGLDTSSKHFVEETYTTNVSLEGLAFLTSFDLGRGQLLTVSAPDKFRIQAKLVWIGDTQKSGQKEVGAQLIPPIGNWVVK
jgi:hypothetical protein